MLQQNYLIIRLLYFFLSIQFTVEPKSYAFTQPFQEKQDMGKQK